MSGGAGDGPRGRRITIVLNNLDLGGAERQALQLGSGLARDHGAVVDVIGLGRAGAAATHADRLGLPSASVRLVPLPPRVGLRLAARAIPYAASVASILRAVRSRRPEVLLGFTNWPNVLMGNLWDATGASAFLWNQRDEGLEWEDLPRRTTARAVRRTPAFVANSQAGARYLVDALDAPADRVLVIRNGVNLGPPEHDRLWWRTHLAVEDDRFLVGMVASMTGLKDHETLLRAWQIVVGRSAQRPPILALAGRQGQTSSRIEGLIRDLGLGPHVRVVGAVEDVAGFLAALDVAALVSRSEGLSNSVLEAMAAGLPVVASDIPGCREALGPDAVLVPPGDAHALAARLEGVLRATPEARNREADANRRRAIAEFPPDRAVASLSEVIEDLLRRRESS